MRADAAFGAGKSCSLGSASDEDGREDVSL